jgi:uncharacterized protein
VRIRHGLLAEANAKDNGGNTALMWASLKGHREIEQVLLDKGADVNAKANDGTTALMLATEKGYNGIRELLLKAGAK